MTEEVRKLLKRNSEAVTEVWSLKEMRNAINERKSFYNCVSSFGRFWSSIYFRWSLQFDDNAIPINVDYAFWMYNDGERELYYVPLSDGRGFVYVYDEGTGQWFGNEDWRPKEGFFSKRAMRPDGDITWVPRGYLTTMVYAGGYAKYIASRVASEGEI